MRSTTKVLTFLTAIACSTAANASSCNVPIKVPIKFNRGASCWTYSGVGTTFYGNFAAGQHITAQAIATMIMSDRDAQATHLDISGYSHNAVVDASGKRVDWSPGSESYGNFDAYTGSAGQYEFSIAPCAAWGAPLIIMICAGKTKSSESPK